MVTKGTMGTKDPKGTKDTKGTWPRDFPPWECLKSTAVGEQQKKWKNKLRKLEKCSNFIWGIELKKSGTCRFIFRSLKWLTDRQRSRRWSRTAFPLLIFGGTPSGKGLLRSPWGILRFKILFWTRFTEFAETNANQKIFLDFIATMQSEWKSKSGKKDKWSIPSSFRMKVTPSINKK